MSLSPTKQRTLPRQPSSPSLNLGLPPPIPSAMISPSSSSRTLKRTRSRPRIRRGDVESSATSADEFDDEDTFLVPAAKVRATASVEAQSQSSTPRRKVAGPIEPATVGRGTKKRETLAERLAAAAKIKKSRSVDGLAMATQGSMTSIGSIEGMSLAAAGSALREGSVSTGAVGGTSDKVVVCVRIKPTSSPFLENAYELSPTSLELSDQHPNVIKRGGKQGREAEYAYTFDMLLKQPSKTPDLYSSQVAPLVDKTMNGFNSTVFAYGQTGSGKSFTMTGHPAELGIIPCAVDGVFDAITADMDRAFLLRVSYIEIYNETLRDLLNFKKTNKDTPAIHTNKGKVYVDPLVEEIVSTPQDVMKLLSKGNEGRKVGATDWNDRSSRSHCVFTIVIESRPRDGDGDDDIRLSRLNLIDLAGSEKAVSDLERRGEGKHINQSLLALREVINKLTEKKRSHIPYRNSKLTHLLENALGGDSNICVICTISAEEEHASETLETLKFAGRCSQVETKAKKNILMGSERALIRAKDAEIEELKSRLIFLAADGSKVEAASSSSTQVSELADSVADLENRKARLKDQLAKLNGEILTSELPRLGHGLPLSPPRPKRRRISEFLGAGKPKGVAVVDRRAVSGLVKVSEDHVMVVDTETLENAAVSTLRQALTRKDAELSLLRAEITQLRTAQSTSQNHHLDVQHDLEVTRSDLVSTISSKSLHIDNLEETILDLRQSREDLLIEDQTRLDGVQKKLDVVLMESERAKRVADGDLPSELELAKQAYLLRLDQMNKTHAIEVERLRGENKKLGGQLRDRWNVAEEAMRIRKETEGKNLALEAEVAESREATARYTSLVKEVEEIKVESTGLREQVKRIDYLDSADLALKAEVERLEVAGTKMQGLEVELERLKEVEVKLGEMEVEKDLMRSERMEALAKFGEMEVVMETMREEGLKKLAELEGGKRRAEVDLADFQKKVVGVESEVVGDLKRRLGEKCVELESIVKAREEAVRSLETSTTKLRAIEVERDTIRAELLGNVETQSVLRKELDSVIQASKVKLSEVQLERDTIRSELSVNLDMVSTLQKDLQSTESARVELESRLKAVQARVEEKELQIDQLNISLAETTRQLVEVREMTGGKDEIVTHLQSDLAKLAKELDDAHSSKSTISAELDSVSKSKSVSDESVSRLRMELEEKRAAASVLETQILTAAAAVDKEMGRAEKAEKEADRVNVESKIRTKALEEELRQTKADLEDRRTNAGSAHQALELVRAEHKAAKDQIASITSTSESTAAELVIRTRDDELLHTKFEAIQAEHRSTTEQLTLLISSTGSTAAQLEKATAQLSDRDRALSLIQDQLTAKESEIDTLRNSASGGDAKIQQLRGEVDELTRQLENQGSVVSSLTRQVEDVQKRRNGLEGELEVAKAEIAGKAIVAAELQLARSELSASRTKILSIEKDLHAAQIRIEGLTKEVGEARKANSNRPVKGSLPTIHSSTSISDLSGSSSRQGIAGMRERAEIDRLERVIEEQQAVIDDQREKIKFWSNELERQREIVKMLTSTPDSQTTPTRQSPAAGTRHIKAHSLSSTTSSGFSPLPSTDNNRVSGMPKKSLTSTFTARNLALPSLTTPMPMPMHTAQYSNTAVRKGRRVTIENDLDVLSEGSKVGLAKAIFESPEKNQIRSGVAGWSDSPKQRRP